MDTQVPENLGDLDNDQLTELEEALLAEFDERMSERVTPAELEEIATAIDRVRAQQTANAEAEEAEEAARAELAERVRPSEPEVEEAAEGDDLDAELAELIEEEAAEGEEAPAEPEVAVEEAAEPVAASAARRRAPSARAMRRRAPEPPAAAMDSDVVITAAADVPGLSTGARISKLRLAEAMHAKARGMSDRGPRLPVATLATATPKDLVIGNGDDPMAIIEEAVRRQLSPGMDAEALVASGGWCTPSENLFDQFSVESRDGLLDLPSVGVTRGGVNVPSYFGISDVQGALWSWDETKDNNTPTDSKPCLQVPCPTWTDRRLEAEGLCLTHGNLMDRAYPELTARILDLTVTAHLHRLSNAMLADIIASATAVTVTTAPSDAAGDILHAVDLQVADFRSEHLMGTGVVLDAIFPLWFIEAIRSCLAMRAGVAVMAVSNAEIVSHFTVRNVRPQFLHGYEPLFDTNPAVAFPATSKFLIYPTGSYVMGDGGEIDLGVVRDSTLNSTNDFTLAWSEQFYNTIQRGPAAREVTVTTDVDGGTGGPAFMPIAA